MAETTKAKPKTVAKAKPKAKATTASIKPVTKVKTTPAKPAGRVDITEKKIKQPVHLGKPKKVEVTTKQPEPEVTPVAAQEVNSAPWEDTPAQSMQKENVGIEQLNESLKEEIPNNSAFSSPVAKQQANSGGGLTLAQMVAAANKKPAFSQSVNTSGPMTIANMTRLVNN